MVFCFTYILMSLGFHEDEKQVLVQSLSFNTFQTRFLLQLIFQVVRLPNAQANAQGDSFSFHMRGALTN